METRSRQEAKEKGTQVHLFIQNYIKKELIPQQLIFNDESYTKKLKNLINRTIVQLYQKENFQQCLLLCEQGCGFGIVDLAIATHLPTQKRPAISFLHIIDWKYSQQDYDLQKAQKYVREAVPYYDIVTYKSISVLQSKEFLGKTLYQFDSKSINDSKPLIQEEEEKEELLNKSIKKQPRKPKKQNENLPETYKKHSFQKQSFVIPPQEEESQFFQKEQFSWQKEEEEEKQFHKQLNDPQKIKTLNDEQKQKLEHEKLFEGQTHFKNSGAGRKQQFVLENLQQFQLNKIISTGQKVNGLTYQQLVEAYFDGNERVTNWIDQFIKNQSEEQIMRFNDGLFLLQLKKLLSKLI